MLVRTLSDARTNNAQFVSTADLAAFYRVWGIELSFQTGPDFSYDPTDDPAEVDELRQQYQPSSLNAAAPALMIMAATCSKGAHVNGMLLDTKRRGICAIFTQSTRYATGNAETRFEIAAHEIGHMLNLVHGFADAPYPTAMNQYDQRAKANRRAVWQQHIASTPVNERAGMTGFFKDGVRSPMGLPLSPHCHQHIIGAPAHQVLPWQSQFNDVISEGADVDSPVELQLSIGRSSIEVGQSIDISVTLSLSVDAAPLAIPQGLGLSEGTLELHIHSEAGSRKYIPRKLLCTEGTRLLTSRGKVRRSYSLLGDATGLLFPQQGAYRVEVRLPAIGARSEKIDVLVGKPTQELALPKLQAFLASGMPSEDSAGWLLLTQAAKNLKIDRAVRAHFASEIESRRPINAALTAGIVAAAKYESPRSYQKNLLLRLSREARIASGTKSANARLIEEAESTLRADDDQHPSLEFIQKLRATSARGAGK
ncbi:hypothetical protein DT070_00005 [Polaromonas sp. SP1]|nr:hypothetical protein DT070_00005 [Polaromonas sp. SP1]